MSSWFKRAKDNILTSTDQKIETPDGLWTQCPSCKKTTHIKDLKANLHVCPQCDHHYKINSKQYFDIIFEKEGYQEINSNILPTDPLEFVDKKSYAERLQKTQIETQLNDAVRSAVGKLGPYVITASCMDFEFIGGSMGSVVGEKIARAIEHAIQIRSPFIMISKSGGARMMEGSLSLMQMAKTSAKLALLSEANLPYISLMTDPTTGGVTASFAMLGDFNLAEPNALIGFAGPRVIKETIGKDLPQGFQSSEFLLEHGFIDFILNRKELKSKLITLLSLIHPW